MSVKMDMCVSEYERGEYRSLCTGLRNSRVHI
jgi:hypothetical protein